jgi:hypothetical protein
MESHPTGMPTVQLRTTFSVDNMRMKAKHHKEVDSTLSHGSSISKLNTVISTDTEMQDSALYMDSPPLSKPSTKLILSPIINSTDVISNDIIKLPDVDIINNPNVTTLFDELNNAKNGKVSKPILDESQQYSYGNDYIAIYYGKLSYNFKTFIKQIIFKSCTQKISFLFHMFTIS